MTNVNPDNQPQLPLRGLAMVLIAVAALLALWGLYSTTQDSDPVVVPPTSEAAPVTTTTTPQKTETETETSEEPTETDTEEPEKPEAGERATAPARLHVINNSTVPNLAAEVADTLGRDGYQVGEVGNLADHILPETTVFFQPGNDDAERRARELADRVGGVARAYDSFLPEGTGGRDDLTLVLVDRVNL